MKKRLILSMLCAALIATSGCGSPVNTPAVSNAQQVNENASATESESSTEISAPVEEKKEDTKKETAKKYDNITDFDNCKTGDDYEKHDDIDGQDDLPNSNTGDVSTVGVGNDDYWDKIYEDLELEVDDKIVAQYLNLPKKDYDEAYVYDEFEWKNAESSSLPLIKLAEFKKENISVYATTAQGAYGIIVVSNDKREFFPIGWGYGYSDPLTTLTDIDDDGEKELIFIAVKIHGTGLYRDSLNVFKFGDDGKISYLPLDEKEWSKNLSKFIWYDATKKAVIVKNCKDFKEIPLTEYLKDETEPVIEELSFIDNWRFEPAESSVLMSLVANLYVKDAPIPLYSQTIEYTIKLKNGEFYIVPIN